MNNTATLRPAAGWLAGLRSPPHRHDTDISSLPHAHIGTSRAPDRAEVRKSRKDHGNTGGGARRVNPERRPRPGLPDPREAQSPRQMIMGVAVPGYPAVKDHCWFAPPVLAAWSSRVPAVAEEPGTSTTSVLLMSVMV